MNIDINVYYNFSAILSSLFLNESLNSLGKVGVILSLIGSTMIVIHAPRHERVSNFNELVVRCSDPGKYCDVLIFSNYKHKFMNS